MLSRVFERFLHCTRVFTVCCAGARRHLSEDGLSELVPYPRARSLHCPAFSPDVCGARFGLHVVSSRRSFLLRTKRGCCKVSSHGFGVISRTQMTPAKQPNTTSFCLSACLWVTRVFQHCAHVVARDNSMVAGVAVEVNTQIVMSLAKISNVPWCPHPFQCRPNPRECPLTSTLIIRCKKASGTISSLIETGLILPELVRAHIPRAAERSDAMVTSTSMSTCCKSCGV